MTLKHCSSSLILYPIFKLLHIRFIFFHSLIKWLIKLLSISTLLLSRSLNPQHLLLDLRVLLEPAKQVVHLHILCIFDRNSRCIGLDQISRQVLLEHLKWVYLLFKGILEDETVNIDCPLLSDSVCPIDGLQISHRVPWVLHENHSVCTR